MHSGPPAISVEIRRLREDRGLSQEAVARLLGIGIKSYRDFETKREPSLERLRQIAALYDGELVVEIRTP